MSEDKFIVELRPDQNLLDLDFGGYKLSLDSVPIYRKTIDSGVDIVQPNDDQFSYAHMKLFSLHNHLHVNRFTNALYFIDKNWKINKVKQGLLNKFDDLQIVGIIPALHENNKRLYNVSMVFISSDCVILSDGAGTIYVISIQCKDNIETWQIVSENVLSEGGTGFILNDAQLLDIKQSRVLHVVFMHIQEKTDDVQNKIGTSMFHTVLEWITLLENHTGNYIKQSSRVLVVEGNVDYVFLEPGAKYLYLIADKAPKWIHDSENEIRESKPLESGNNKNSEKIYTWLQEEEELTVWVPIPKNAKKNDFMININNNYLEIKLFNEPHISGKLFSKIDNNLTSWSFDKDKVEIHLMKQETGLMWQNLIIDDNKGEQIYDANLVGIIHDKLAHLCSDKEADPGPVSLSSEQLEDCDTVSNDSQALMRINSETHVITHEVNLSSFQWLFKTYCVPEGIPAICLRHDFDACVWQFSKPSEGSKMWPNQHIGTFFAFGYVQASKNQKKFLTCPPDLSYAVVCEASRYIYLYRQPSLIIGELRNRTSGKTVSKMSKQQVINLDTNEQILGIHATNSLLFVLAENTINLLIVN